MHFSVPRHIAFIMDGNRRWADKNGLNRMAGHQSGYDKIKDVIDEALRIGISYLTFFAFSTENWRRTQEEVGYLMGLLRRALAQEIDKYNEQGVRILIIGDQSRLPEDIQKLSKNVVEKLKNNTKITVVFAISYGGRDDITSAAKLITEKVMSGELSVEQITEEVFSNHISTANIPDPDLLIRTGGEIRISNFLVWQLAYTEMVFLSKYWPEFEKEDLVKAIETFSKRKRNYGE